MAWPEGGADYLVRLASKPRIRSTKETKRVMVVKGTDSSSDLAKALAAAQQVAARADWLKPAAEPVADELNYANTPWRGQEQEAAIAQLAGGDDKKITEHDIEEIFNLIVSQCVAAGVSASDLNEILAKLRSNVGAPKDNLEDVKRAARDMAQDAVSSAASSKEETPEEAIERLWGEIGELNKKADDLFDELDAYSTPEEKKLRKELREAVEKETDEKKKLELQKRLNELDRKVADRAQEQAPPGSKEHETGKELKDNTDKRDDRLKGIRNQETKLAQKTAELQKQESMQKQPQEEMPVSRIDKLLEKQSATYVASNVPAGQSGQLQVPSSPSSNAGKSQSNEVF